MDSIEFVPDSSLIPGEKYTIIVEDIKPVVSTGHQPITKVFTHKIQDPPKIASITPLDKSLNVPLDNKITLVLANENKNLRKLKIESNLPLKDFYPISTDDRVFYWELAQRLERNRSYFFKITDELQKNESGKVIANNTFSTVPGIVEVTSYSHQGYGFIPNSPVGLTFNQEVNRMSAERAFFITPDNTTGSFSWDENKLIFTPKSQLYATRYTYGVNAGVESVYGLNSVDKFSNSYTTDYRSVKLSVPAYKQTYRLSCEESALRMALAYRGISASDWEILQRVGYNPKPRDTVNNTWDDPNIMYVGDVNGVMGVTGWGVYAGPLAQASKSYGRDAEASYGVTAGQIAQAIYDNNPVILWGIIGNSLQSDSWLNSEGKNIFAPLNAHVRLVYGVKGDASNPIGFYIHDPLYGSIYWTRAQLEWDMSFAGTNQSQSVIVR